MSATVPTIQKKLHSTEATNATFLRGDRLTPQSHYYSAAYQDAVTQLEDNGQLHVFAYDDAVVPLILRPLPCGDSGYDAITPYDFAGPWIVGDNASDAWDSLCSWARSRNVVSAFLRFHPYESKPQAWANLNGLEVSHVANHVCVDLDRDNSALVASFKPTARRYERVARRSNVTTALERFTEDNVGDFSRLYSQTMERLRASKYYRFPESFFAALARIQGGVFSIAKALYQGETVAAVLLLLDGERAFYFLACSDESGRTLRAMNLLVHDTAMALSKRGFTQFHLGGGTEGLLSFKQRFGPACVPLYIGRAVFDADRYAELSRNCRSDFFPAYRAPRESAGL